MVFSSLLGFSIHGISQARTLEWVAISFSGGIFLTQRLNPHLLPWKVDSLAYTWKKFDSDYLQFDYSPKVYTMEIVTGGLEGNFK